MVGTLQRVLVCSPQTAGWNQPQRIARWRELGFHHAPNFEKAQSQHVTLVRELQNAGTEIAELPPGNHLSLDAVYAHDASLPTDFGLILMRPGKANRVTEADIMARLLRSKAFQLLGRSRLPEPPKPETWSGSTRRHCSLDMATVPTRPALLSCAPCSRQRVLRFYRPRSPMARVPRLAFT